MIEVTLDGIAFSRLTFDDIVAMTEDLAGQIIDSGEQFDRIIPLANGGLTMARHLSDLVNIPKISVMQTSYYSGVNERLERPIIVQDIQTDIQGEKILLFEDVVDTGETIAFACEHLYNRGAEVIKVATQTTKPHTKVQPDWAAAEFRSWLIFPYETRETIETLAERWQEMGKPFEQILSDLRSLGYSENNWRNIL